MQDLLAERDTLRPASDAASRRVAVKVDLCRRALSSGVPLRLRVSGTSMLPALWPGESVAVVPTNIEDLKIGEVVVFVSHDHFVVHRLVGRIADSAGVALIARGDAQLHDDAPVRAPELLGVVTAVHRFGADRPMHRRLPAIERGLAWIIRRSSVVRSALDRVNSVLVHRAMAAQATRTGWGGVRPGVNPWQ